MNRHRTVTRNGTPKDAVCKLLYHIALLMRRVGIEPTTYRFATAHRLVDSLLFPLCNLFILGRNLLKKSIAQRSDRYQTVILQSAWRPFCRAR
jgi:hypothetical protein